MNKHNQVKHDKNIQVKSLIILLLYYSFFICEKIACQNEQKIWQWTQTIGGEGWDIANGIMVDSNNKIYVAGDFVKNLQNGEKVINATGNRDIYVSCFNSKGKLNWFWQGGGNNYDKITNILKAPNHDIYISGTIDGDVCFGKEKIKEKGKNVFLARLNNKGKTQWVNTLSYYNYASGYLLQEDQNGNILLAGTYSDSLICDGHKLISKGCNDIFIANYSPEGKVLKLKSFGTSANEDITALAIDSLGKIYLSGNIENELFINETKISAKFKGKDKNSFIVRMDDQFNVLWSKSLNSPSHTKINGILCDCKNNVLFAGDYIGRLQIDTLVYESKGLNDVYICKSDSLGNIKWLKTFGSEFDERIHQITLNNFDGAMLMGSFQDTLKLDSILITTSQVSTQAFVAQLTKNGEITWGDAISSNGNSFCEKGGVDINGNLYLIGSYKGKIIDDNMSAESLGDEDIFITKYHNCSETTKAINGPKVICEGSSATLFVDKSFQNVIWNDTLTNVREMTIFKSGQYHVEMIDEKGCLIKDSVQIKGISAKEFFLGNDTSIYIGEQIKLRGPENAFAYRWQDGSIDKNYKVINDHKIPGKYKYELTITDVAGCKWNDEIFVDYIKKPVSDNLLEHVLINIYPNPFVNYIEWELNDVKKREFWIEIIDEFGHVYYLKKINDYQSGEKRMIKLPKLIPQLYYFSIISNQGRITKKIIKAS